VRLQGLCPWKIPIKISGIDPATFRFVAHSDCNQYLLKRSNVESWMLLPWCYAPFKKKDNQRRSDLWHTQPWYCNRGSFYWTFRKFRDGIEHTLKWCAPFFTPISTIGVKTGRTEFCVCVCVPTALRFALWHRGCTCECTVWDLQVRGYGWVINVMLGEGVWDFFGGSLTNSVEDRG
jgi:hypothetical protein